MYNTFSFIRNKCSNFIVIQYNYNIFREWFSWILFFYQEFWIQTNIYIVRLEINYLQKIAFLYALTRWIKIEASVLLGYWLLANSHAQNLFSCLMLDPRGTNLHEDFQFLSVCLSVCLSVFSSVCLSFCLSVCLSDCL